MLPQEEQALYRKFRVLALLRMHPVFAVFLLFGIKLAPHQCIILRTIMNAKRKENVTDVLIAMSRGGAKSFMLFVIDNLLALLYPKEKVAYYNGVGYKGGKKLFSDMEAFISRSPFIVRSLATQKAYIHRGQSYWSVKYKHLSEVFTSSLNLLKEGNTARGPRATILTKDERNLMETTLVKQILSPYQYTLKDPTSKRRKHTTSLSIDAGTVGWDFEPMWQLIEYYQKQVEKGKTDKVPLLFDFEDAFVLYGQHTLDDFVQKLKEFRHDKERGRHVSVTEYVKDVAKVFYWFDFVRIMEDKEDPLGDIDVWYAEMKNRPLRSELGDMKHFIAKLLSNPPEFKGREERLKPLYTTEDPVLISIDYAREQDYLAFLAFRLGFMADSPFKIDRQEGKTEWANLIWAERYLELTAFEASKVLHNWLQRYPNTKFIVLDKRGGGASLRDELIFPRLANHKPIYDPDDKDTIAKFERQTGLSITDVGLPLLRLVSATDVFNYRAFMHFKNLMKKPYVFVPHGQVTLESDSEEIQAYRQIKIVLSQVSKIKIKHTSQGMSFDLKGVPLDDVGKRKATKDYFSALIYAMYFIYELIRESVTSIKKRPLDNVDFSEGVIDLSDYF